MKRLCASRTKTHHLGLAIWNCFFLYFPTKPKLLWTPDRQTDSKSWHSHTWQLQTVQVALRMCAYANCKSHKVQGHLHKLARNPKEPKNRQTIDPNAAGLQPGEEVGGHPTPVAFSYRILMAICMLNFIWKFKWYDE